MEKEEIRKEMLSKRDDLPKDKVEEISRHIKNKLFKLPEFRDAKKVLIYLHFRKEVKTSGIIKECLAQGKEVFVPVSDFEKNEFSISPFPGFENLEKDKFGVPFPKKEFIKEADSSQLDLIIAPGVAFDLEGNRIGFGKGFYDKFISAVDGNPLVIGLAFDFQLLDLVPTERDDIPVTMVITEKRIVSV